MSKTTNKRFTVLGQVVTVVTAVASLVVAIWAQQSASAMDQRGKTRDIYLQFINDSNAYFDAVAAWKACEFNETLPPGASSKPQCKASQDRYNELDRQMRASLTTVQAFGTDKAKRQASSVSAAAEDYLQLHDDNKTRPVYEEAVRTFLDTVKSETF